MPIPAGMGSGAVGAATPQQQKALDYVRHNPGRVVLALPGQRNKRSGIVRIYIFDDQREIFTALAYELYQAGIDINSMYAASPQEELWLEPVFASRTSDMEEHLRWEEKLEMALFDIKLNQPGKSGLDLLVDARMRSNDAFLAPQSSVIQNMSEQQAFRAADTGIMKDIVPKLRAYYLYAKALFGASPHRPNPEWVQTCDTCEFYEAPPVAAEGASSLTGKCLAVRSSDPKLGFFPGTLCYWLNLPALEAAYAAIKARGGTGHFVGAQIETIKNYVGTKAASDKVRAMIEARQKERPKLSLGSNRTFFDRSPMVLRPEQLVIMLPSLIENIGIPRLRSKGSIFPPPQLFKQWEQIQKEFIAR